MGVRKLKPVTNGQRHAVLYDFAEITKREPEKSLTYFYKRAKGRSHGKITVRSRGGGHKKEIQAHRLQEGQEPCARQGGSHRV
jgi:large subunit ribosomal protein L2